MKLPVVWMPEADADVKEAQAWYDAVRPALGEQFCAGSQRGSGGDRRKSAAFPGHLPTPAAGTSLTFPLWDNFRASRTSNCSDRLLSRQAQSDTLATALNG